MVLLRPALAIGLVLALLAFVPAVMASHAQPLPGGGSITFKDKAGGNEWWVEAVVTSTSPVSKVEVMDDGGAWATMTNKPEWGSWALGYHVEAGHRVTFRATTAAGVVTSCPFTHPAGVEQCDSQPPPGGFQPTFAAVRGNEWWVQGQVKANAGFTLSKVEVTLNGQLDWKPLTKQSWGDSMYAASYHIPQGAVVQLRAHSTSGNTNVSDCYKWIPASNTDATKVSCTGPPDTSKVWKLSGVDGFDGGSISQMTIGDADRDGKGELYVASYYGIRREITNPDQTPHMPKYVGSTVSTLTGWDSITAGDGDNDGLVELYATRFGDVDSELHRISLHNGAWTDAILYTSDAFLGPVTVGDADADGQREVYVGDSDADGGNAVVTQVRRDGTSWRATPIADLGNGGSFRGVDSLWIGDGDRDGRLELAVGVYGSTDTSHSYLLEKGASGWTATLLASGGQVAGIVAGDVDGDGLGEVVMASIDGDLVQSRLVNGAWQTQTITPLPSGVQAIFLADGDNDGRSEVYATVTDGNVYMVTQSPGMHSTKSLVGRIGMASEHYGPLSLVVGDGDGDGQREVYFSLYHLPSGDEYVDVLDFEAAFAATFSNVAGNSHWAEVVVKGNEPVQMVLAYIGDCDHDGSDMVYRADWGKWVLGVPIPDGSRVVFEAYGQTGVVRSGGYTWPQATPTAGC